MHVKVHVAVNLNVLVVNVNDDANVNVNVAQQRCDESSGRAQGGKFRGRPSTPALRAYAQDERRT